MYQRRQARLNLLPYTEYTLPRYEAAEHHKHIASKLEAVARGVVRRLMIFMPPRHGKSELASKRLPAWYLGQHPERSIIAASYNSELAGDFGREVRNIIASPEHLALFPGSGLAQDSQAANRWHTQAGGSYVAAGVGTAVTGRGADLLLIDDPHKDRAEADSEVSRDHVWNWYTSTAYTRLTPNGCVVLIQTRWHEDDLAGRLLEAQKHGGDQWEVINLPAIIDGKALWPERYDLPALERIRSAIGTRDWSALYQQSPAPEEGNWFKREWLHYYDTKPERLHCYGASDYAVTADGGDYTVHAVAGLDPEGNLYILDWWRGQEDTLTWTNAMLEMIKRHRPMEWADEGGPIGRGVSPFIERMMAELGLFVHRPSYPAARNETKQIRSNSIRGRMAQGRVFFPRNAPWLADFISELLVFPAGKHDDQVDALSMLGIMLDRMQDAARPVIKLPQDTSKAMVEMTFQKAMKLGQGETY